MLKWTAQDFANAPEGGLPMGQAPDEWAYGDLDAGFKSAAVVVDETFVVQSTGHQPMESRSAMAYWQNGKLLPARLDAERRAHASIRSRAGSAWTRRTSC